MKLFLLFLFILFSSCSKIMHKSTPVIQMQEPVFYEVSPAIQEQETIPLILGGKQYRQRLLEDASSLLYVTFNIDPLDPNKMNSLENIELLTKIREIRIDGKNMDKVDFSLLSVLVTLEELHIEGDISHLPDLTSLEKLTWIKIKKSALTNLKSIGAPNLINIEVQMKSFDSLAPLSNLSKLELVRIWSSESDFAAIGGLTNVPKLKHLDLGYKGIIDLAGIERLTSLEELELGSHATPINTQGISSLQNLVFLKMYIIKDENPSIEYLRGLKNLKYVSIYGKNWVFRIDEGKKPPQQILDVSPLAESLKLEQLTLSGFIIKNISALNHLENLMPDYIYLDDSQLFDESEMYNSTHRLIFDSSTLRDS